MKLFQNFIVPGAIILLAFALRLYRLGYREFWYDELSQIVAAQRDIPHLLAGVAKHAGAAPLDYLITHATLTIGQEEAILRLPAALWGTLAVILIYLLARQVAGESAALTTAFIYAVTPKAIRYSQELRFYSLGVLLALLAVWVFWRAQEENSRRWWVAWCAVLTVGLYAHYYLAFVALACGLWVLPGALRARRDMLWRVGLAAGLAGLLFLPWVIFDLSVKGFSSLVPAIAWSDLFWAPLANGDPLTWPLWALFALAVMTLPWQRPIVALFVFVAVSAFAGAPLLDRLGGYPFYPRQALISLPFMLLAGVCGLFGLLERNSFLRRRNLEHGLFLAAAVLIFWLPKLAVRYPSAFPDNGLRATVAVLRREVEPGDVIVIGGDALVFRVYAPDLKAQIPAIPYGAQFDGYMAKLTARHPRLFLVVWNFQAAAQLERWAKAHHAQNITPWKQGATRIYLMSQSQY